jgi:hypothetical protein
VISELSAVVHNAGATRVFFNAPTELAFFFNLPTVLAYFRSLGARSALATLSPAPTALLIPGWGIAPVRPHPSSPSPAGAQQRMSPRQGSDAFALFLGRRPRLVSGAPLGHRNSPMSEVSQWTRNRNERDPYYCHRPSELHGTAMGRLFERKLHTRPAVDVIFASRGKARSQALTDHLLNVQASSGKAARPYSHAAIRVRAMPSHQHAGLQVADYCLWALQRLFTKGEARFLSLIWPKVGLIADADDTSEQLGGTYYTRNHNPLDAQKIKSRKVED